MGVGTMGAESTRGEIARKRWWPPVIVSAVAAGAVFWPTLGNGFVFDDDEIVLMNPAVTDSGWPLRFFTARYWPIDLGSDPLYRPITLASLRLNYLVGGDRPGGYHLTNLLLHGAVSALVAALAMGLWSRAAAGWVAGLLYAVHPVHVEAVAPIVGRSELLAACFGLAALYVRLSDPAPEPCVRWRRVAAIGPLFFLALGSKEHAVLLYPVFVLIDLWRRRTIREIRDLPMRVWLNRVVGPAHLILLTALIAFFVLRWNVYEYRLAPAQRSIPYHANPVATATGADRVLTPLALTALTARVLVWPAGLTPFYDVGNLQMATSLFEPRVLLGVILVVGIGVLMVWAWRRSSPLTVILGGLAVCLLVPCQYVSLAAWLFAERWLYLPSVFAALAVAGLVRFAPRSIISVAVLASIGLAGVTVSYARIWRDDLTLHLAALARRPGSFYGQIGALVDLTRSGRYDEAGPLADEVFERFPDSYIATVRVFEYHLEVGDLERAERALKRLYEIEPLSRMDKTTKARLRRLRAQVAPAPESGPQDER